MKPGLNFLAVNSESITRGLEMAKSSAIILTFALLVIGTARCGSSSSGGSGNTTPTCHTPGTSLNVGGAAAMRYTADLGSGVTLVLNTGTVNFEAYSNQNEYIADLGSLNCLDGIMASSWPGGTSTAIAFSIGHVYMYKYLINGNYVYAAFVANSYSSGVANISYVSGI